MDGGRTRETVMKTSSSSKTSTKVQRPPKEGDMIRMGFQVTDVYDSDPLYRYGLYLGKDEERSTLGVVMWFDSNTIGHGYSIHRMEIVND